jgi:hypothetical protein
VLLTHYFCFSNQANGLWNRLESRKPIFVEPRRKVEFKEVSSLTVYIFIKIVWFFQNCLIFFTCNPIIYSLLVKLFIKLTSVSIKLFNIPCSKVCKILQQHH